jgi:hypothetical protein
MTIVTEIFFSFYELEGNVALSFFSPLMDDKEQEVEGSGSLSL